MSLLVSLGFAFALALGLLLVADRLLQQDLANAANRLNAILLAVGLAGPSGITAGLVAHFAFRGQRSRREGRLLWRSYLQTVPLLGAVAGALTPILLLWVLLPLYWRLVIPGQASPLDSFMEAAFPLVLVGGVAGGLGAFAATLLHRPSRETPS